MPKTTSAGESSVWSWDDGTPLEFDDETGAPLPPAPPASEVPVDEPALSETPVDEPTPDEVPADEPTSEPVPAWPVVDITPSGPPMDGPADEPVAQPVDEPVDGPAPFTF